MTFMLKAVNTSTYVTKVYYDRPGTILLTVLLDKFVYLQRRKQIAIVVGLSSSNSGKVLSCTHHIWLQYVPKVKVMVFSGKCGEAKKHTGQDQIHVT